MPDQLGGRGSGAADREMDGREPEREEKRLGHVARNSLVRTESAKWWRACPSDTANGVENCPKMTTVHTYNKNVTFY